MSVTVFHNFHEAAVVCLLCEHDHEAHSIKYGQVRCTDCPDGVCLCSCAGCKDNRNTDGAA